MIDPGYSGAPREPDLVDLSTYEAMTLRWQRGRAARGLGPCDPFEGDPLRELYEELIDALCYVREAARQGQTLGRRLERELGWMASTVRARIRIRNVSRGVP